MVMKNWDPLLQSKNFSSSACVPASTSQGNPEKQKKMIEKRTYVLGPEFAIDSK